MRVLGKTIFLFRLLIKCKRELQGMNSIVFLTGTQGTIKLRWLWKIKKKLHSLAPLVPSPLGKCLLDCAMHPELSNDA